MSCTARRFRVSEASAHVLSRGLASYPPSLLTPSSILPASFRSSLVLLANLLDAAPYRLEPSKGWIKVKNPKAPAQDGSFYWNSYVGRMVTSVKWRFPMSFKSVFFGLAVLVSASSVSMAQSVPNYGPNPPPNTDSFGQVPSGAKPPGVSRYGHRAYAYVPNQRRHRSPYWHHRHWY